MVFWQGEGEEEKGKKSMAAVLSPERAVLCKAK